MTKITLGESTKIRNLVARGTSPEQVAAEFGITVSRVKGFCPKVKSRKKPKAEATEPAE